MTTTTTTSVVRLFAGIEGGGTKTLCSLVSEFGEVLANETTGPTNPWLLNHGAENGFVVASNRIHALINKSLDRLGDSSSAESPAESNSRIANGKEYRLEAAALCLSGAGTKIVHERIANELVVKLNVKYKVYIGNDTLAPIFTAFENGGLVIISGTGSKCVLVNPISNLSNLNTLDDIGIFSSGGWGNLLGDEGSAYWIAQKTIKYVIDYYDNFLLDFNYSGDIDQEILNKEGEELKNIIFNHFNVTSFDDLLPFFYSDFKKDFIASLTAKLADVAKNGIILKKIFEDSGYELARHIIAIQPKIDKKLLAHSLPIVCTGSVFKSWNLIKPGFIRCLENQMDKVSNLNEIKLVSINGDSTVGAAILAARIFDPQINLWKYFDAKALTTQLDHFYVSKLNKTQFHHHHHHHSLQQNIHSMNNLKMDEIVIKQV